MKLSHFFLPHPETHKKAHLISVQALLIYVIIFVLLQFSFNLISIAKPGVLGVSSNIDQQELIRLTNESREKNGLPPLLENSKLNEAAKAKAANMFEEDYWAHYSPTGKDPWGFIQTAGYKYQYAGENLARNFQSSPDVVTAWMNSPTHKENILNSNYQEIGIAVVEGVLKGQKTTLIVQEFGRPVEPLANAPQVNPQKIAQQPSSNATVQAPQTAVAGERYNSNFLIDTFQVTKNLGLMVMALIAVLVIVDIYIMRRRAVERISARHIPHLALLSVAASGLFSMSSGSIL